MGDDKELSGHVDSIVAGVTGGVSTGANAADICNATALRDVPALEDPTSILKKGEIDDSITQFRVNKMTGETSFCSHGGYCYPTHLQVGGDKLQALKMTNCSVGGQGTDDDQGFTSYEVIVNRSKIPPVQLRADDLDNRLRELGLCSACASNVASTSLGQIPDAEVTRRALEGNPDALEILQGMPDYCKLYYR
jgi:hypothetical protein